LLSSHRDAAAMGEEGARRIDALATSREHVADHAQALLEQVEARAEVVREEIYNAFAERIRALEERQEALLQEVDNLVMSKKTVLEEQLADVESWADDHPQYTSDFFLSADAVLNFKISEHDFLEHVPNFGRIDEVSTYASNSGAEGPALTTLKEDRPTFFWVVACDRGGQIRAEGGDTVEAVVSEPEAFAEVVVEDTKDGRYRVRLNPRMAGDYTIAVTIGGEAIVGSPLSLNVRKRTEYTALGVDGAKAILGELQSPSGLCFNALGTLLFVPECEAHQVRCFQGMPNSDSLSLEKARVIGSKGMIEGRLNSPGYSASDKDGRLVVTDTLNHRVQIWDPATGELLRCFGSQGSEDGQLAFPKGVAVTDAGEIFVADGGNCRVQVFDSQGVYLRQFGKRGLKEGQFDRPLGIAIFDSGAGNVIVSDESCRIHVFEQSGSFVRFFGEKGRKDGMFRFPCALAVDDENSIFVCDRDNRRVQVLDANGRIKHKWGGHEKKPAEGEEPPPDEGDQPPKVEWIGLRAPSGIAIRWDGVVAVADALQHEVQLY